MKPRNTTTSPFILCRDRRQGPPRSEIAPQRARRAASRLFVLGLALGTSTATINAQSWETVDDVDAPSATATKVAADSAGNIFVAGYMKDEPTRYHAVVMRSVDGGESWETSADYPAITDQSAPNGPAAGFHVLAAADVNGGSQVIAAGYVKRDYSYGSLFSRQWLVVRSLDGGATWDTLDEFTHPPYPQPQSGLVYPTMSEPNAVAWDASGNVYVAGVAREVVVGRKTTTAYDHWLIRKGVETTEGMVWSLVADIPHTNVTVPSSVLYTAPFAAPTGIACIGHDVYVVGDTGSGSWEVRKSSNGGATWPVIDTYGLSTTGSSGSSGLAGDSQGNLFVAGTGIQKVTSGKGKNATTVTSQYWIVRQGTGGGTSWMVVDQFPVPGGNGTASGVTVDANDEVHVTGTAWTGSSSTFRRWITRERSALTWAWSITDDFALSSAGYSAGKSIAADPSGNLFAAGSGIDSSGATAGWLVRRKLAP